MPRPPRSQAPGVTYHVNTHGVEECTIFRNDADCETFIKRLTDVVVRYHVAILAAALLDTHYHLLMTIEEKNLDGAMQHLNGTYAAGFNRRHRRRGHLFGSRYFSKPVVTEAHFLSTVRYIARNRTAAGAAAGPATDHRSSYAGVIGETECWPCIDRDALLAHFGAGELAVILMREFVEGP